jgi:serine phosphatase RsbU (regulator of sigma subunit)/CHASE3 domain sensor protein
VPYRTRVVALLASLCGILAMVGVVTSLSVARTRALDATLTVRLQPASDMVQTLFIAYLDQETGERGYDLTADKAFLQPFNAGTINAADAVVRLRNVLPDATTRSELAEVIAFHQHWLDVSADPQVGRVAARGSANGTPVSSSVVGKAAFDRLRTAVSALQRDVAARRDDAVRRAAADGRRIFVALAVGTVALAVSVVLAGLLLRRWVLVPTQALRSQLRRVADGFYGEQIGVSGPPELAGVGSDADLMRVRIVTELERSRRSFEALSQSGSVVLDLREELAPSLGLELPGLSLHGVLSPAEGILAGDWYDAVVLPEGRTALLIADISGHGAAAGFVALRVKLRLTSALSLGLGPAAALAHAHATFALEDERFASCVVVVLDPAAGQLRWANAGHPPPMLCTPGGGDAVVRLEPTGPLMSYLGGEWVDRSAAFLPGHLLLGYTDGMTEARDVGGHEFETEGIERVLRALTTTSPVSAVIACLAALHSHAHSLRRDDVTVIAVAHDT